MKSLSFLIFILICISFKTYSQWVPQNSGTSEDLYFIYQLNTDTAFIVGGNGLIKKSTNNGNDWVMKLSGTTSELRDIYFLNNDIGWIVGVNGTILKTIDSGENWITVAPGIQPPPPVQPYLFDIEFLDVNIGFICGGYPNWGVVYKSTDGGSSWIDIFTSSKGASGLDFIDANTGWICGENEYIYKTTDGGTTWVGQHGAPYYSMMDITFVNSNIGFAVNNTGKIYKTINGGNDWFLQAQPTTKAIWEIDFINENQGFIVCSSGLIFKTVDGGSNWIQQESGTNNVLLGISFVNELDGKIVGGNGTILHTTNGGVTFIEDEENNFTRPREFILQQNYPNPFNPGTKISYQIPVAGNVKLKVYDVLGNEVATLINEFKTSGSYDVEFNATNLPSGVYFYQLKADGFIETKKMILLK